MCLSCLPRPRPRPCPPEGQLYPIWNPYPPEAPPAAQPEQSPSSSRRRRAPHRRRLRRCSAVSARARPSSCVRRFYRQFCRSILEANAAVKVSRSGLRGAAMVIGDSPGERAVGRSVGRYPCLLGSSSSSFARVTLRFCCFCL